MLIENTLVGYVVVSDDIVPGQRVYVTTECSEHKNRSRFSYGRIKPVWESPFDGFPYLSIHYWTDKELTMEIYGTQRALPEGLPIFLDRFNANVLASDLRDVNAKVEFIAIRQAPNLVEMFSKELIVRLKETCDPLAADPVRRNYMCNMAHERIEYLNMCGPSAVVAIQKYYLRLGNKCPEILANNWPDAQKIQEIFRLYKNEILYIDCDLYHAMDRWLRASLF